MVNSFAFIQKITRVLTEAAITNDQDVLRGFKQPRDRRSPDPWRYLLGLPLRQEGKRNVGSERACSLVEEGKVNMASELQPIEDGATAASDQGGDARSSSHLNENSTDERP
jgi:hypothetical protein